MCCCNSICASILRTKLKEQPLLGTDPFQGQKRQTREMMEVCDAQIWHTSCPLTFHWVNYIRCPSLKSMLWYCKLYLQGSRPSKSNVNKQGPQFFISKGASIGKNDTIYPSNTILSSPPLIPLYDKGKESFCSLGRSQGHSLYELWPG